VARSRPRRLRAPRFGALIAASVWVLSAGWAVSGASDSPRNDAQSRAPDARAAQPVATAAPHKAVLDRYCVTCHNQRTKTSDLALDSVDVARPGVDPQVWEGVIRKLRTRSMPPQGMPRPDDATYTSLSSWLEAELDRAGAAAPNPGRALIRRLNRAEYANAVRDLLALDVDVSPLLPADDSAFGFDNVSDMLVSSPALLERYLSAADRVSALAVGAPVAPGSDVYRVRQDRSQDQHIEGLPLGSVGGLVARHNFPQDGEYHFSLALYRNNLEAIRGLEHPHQIEITIDGARVFIGTVGGETEKGGPGEVITDRMDAIDARLQVRVPVKAGPHAVGATFVRKIGAGTQRLRPFLRSSAGTYDSTGRPHIETLTVAGPFNPTGPGTTPSRERIFSCRPTSRAQEDACATKIVSTLSRRAFRRPATKAEVARILEFYAMGRKKGDFEIGIQLAIRRILASPNFVFRAEEDGANKPGTIHRVSDLELASRLSFFLWSSIPDEALLDLAVKGQLRQPAVLERQVRRMLADSRAEALVSNFAGQWLHLRNLKTIAPNHDEFPDFDDTLREAFQREAELFFASVMREDHSVLDLLTANYSFVNERLAKHYGVPYVYGSHFRRVTLADDARRGLLGKGAVLMVTSRADRARPPRQVDPGKRAGHSTTAAGAQCAAAAGRQRGGASHAAGADGAAPRQPHLRRLSQGDGPAGLCVGEFRCGRRVAKPGRGTADRCIGTAGRRYERRRRGGAPERARRAVRHLRADFDRKAHDLCARPRTAALRHAGCAGYCAKSREAGLSVLGADHGYRDGHAISDARGGRR
jgi:hypothetical protein